MKPRHFHLNLFLTSFLFAVLLIVPSPVSAQEYYAGMVEEIGGFYEQALDAYEDGNIIEAKSKANAAYFEVFENLEGPIRINISADKNYRLEQEFIGIRKMIIAGESYATIDARVEALMDELDRVVRVLNGEEIPGADVAPVKPAWLAAMDKIRSNLDNAQSAYVDDRVDEAKRLVQQAQFDGYKNTLLETAVRRHVSAAKDFKNNDAFTELIAAMNDEAPDFVIEMSVSSIIENVSSDLPGLPLVDGVEPVQVAEEELPDKDWGAVNDELFAAIDEAIAVHAGGSSDQAAMMVQDAYFDIFEASGMEGRVGARNADRKAELERHFSMLVAQMKKGLPEQDLQQTREAMAASFAETVAALGQGSDSPAALFIYSLLIILREGFEAILIIAAILAYLIKTGHRDKLKVIYNGCIAALVLSVITAVLVKWVFQISAASQEILEGVTMLLAAAVLFSVSYWLISKAEAQKWSSYIQEKISTSLSSGSLKALWLAAFLAVYREGAETVLFYQALSGSASGSAGMGAIAAGFGVGCVLLAIIYLVMRYGAVKLPIKPFFIGTGALLYYMAFVFVGKGIMELIEGKVFEPGLVSWVPTIPFIGVFPYWQSLVLQGGMLLAAVVALVLISRRKQAAPA
ncbi:MAG: FTR1 family iron permease [Desulfuromonadales bacterium]|nr:FTR1 family iron permease [Desulfuromonadales bacterium]NIR33526.1 FTR1 family iron permease [Desulfuromonadales bacterium]NIS39700.1 FTR1 family iron permease [Desulfuromonadales bacterium]